MPAPTRLLACMVGMAEPAGADDTAARHPVARRLLDNWRTHMRPTVDDGSGDYEDFWEMAARLSAAIESGADEVWLHEPRNPQTRLISPTTPDLHEKAIDEFLPDIASRTMLNYGPLARFDALDRHLDTRADRYARTGAFQHHAGRFTSLAGYALDEYQGLHPDPQNGAIEVADVLTDMANLGHTDAIIKHVRAKHGLWRIPITTNRAQNLATATGRLGWALVSLEGTPGMLLVQEAIDMRFEYRIFVVDGQPITGAGCIEEHTPLDADPTTAFSPLLREQRPITVLDHEPDDEDDLPAPSPHAQSPVVSRPDIVERLVKFAEKVARYALDEGSMPRAYVIDCAIDAATDSPIVIEMNGCENAGLYATQPWLVTQALTRPVAVA